MKQEKATDVEFTAPPLLSLIPHLGSTLPEPGNILNKHSPIAVYIVALPWFVCSSNIQFPMKA